MVKILRVDVKTGKEKVVEEDMVLPVNVPRPTGVDLEEVKKVIAKAKTLGWL